MTKPQRHYQQFQRLARLERALQIREALHQLMTVQEADDYEGLYEHFQDYINELGTVHGETLSMDL